MNNHSYKFGKLFFSSIFALLPLNQASILASDILLANNNDDYIEEVRVRRVNKKGNLVVRFCSDLKDYEGYVEVENQKFYYDDADVRKPRRIVWKDTNLPRLKGDDISVDNLRARYTDEDSDVPLRVVDEGSCAIGILPFIVIGGILAGASGGGSGSSSSN